MFCDCTPKSGDAMDQLAYAVDYVDGTLELRLAVPKDDKENTNIDHSKTLFWLTNVFFPKFYKWAKNDRGLPVSSLSHISVKKYCYLYNRLKETYAKSLMDVSVK